MESCNCTTPFVGLPLQQSTCNAASSIFFMTIVNTLLRKKCDVSDICGRIKPTITPDPEYDFIVIGGGGGGSVVAGRLSENKDWKVLVIEMGDDEPVGSQVPSFAYNFLGPDKTTLNFDTVPQEYACMEDEQRQCHYQRGKILGGCGAVNGMTYLRGVPKDYDHWNELGNTGWSYNDVLPYFKKSENNGNPEFLTCSYCHGFKGPLTVERFPYQPPIVDDLLEAARGAGYETPSELNGNVTEGFTISQTMSRNGTRLSSARAYLRPARFRPNLNIMLNSTVTKINFSESNGSVTAKSVEFYYLGKKYVVGVKKEVIMAAGAIGSPQLLLLSGIGPKSDLEEVQVPVVKDLPGVGQNFLNHVAFFVHFNLKNQEDTNLLNWNSLEEYLSRRNGPLSAMGIAMLAARFSSSENLDKSWPDMQFYFNGYVANCTYGCGLSTDPSNPEEPNGTRRIVFQVTLVRPKSKGFIKLKSNNPLEHPILQPNYLENDYDVKALISGIRTAIKVGSAEILRNKYESELVRGQYGNCSELYEFDTFDFWNCAIRYSTSGENHLAGTCKMGPKDDPLAVANPESLKVYGTTNVRIADASAFPTVVAANTFATVVLIGEKAADFIKNDWS